MKPKRLAWLVLIGSLASFLSVNTLSSGDKGPEFLGGLASILGLVLLLISLYLFRVTGNRLGTQAANAIGVFLLLLVIEVVVAFRALG